MKIAIVLLLLKSLSLSFTYKENSPSALYPYYYAASDLSPLGHLSNPAYLPLWETAYINVNYSKPYLMEEINSGNLKIGYGISGLAIQAAWNRFGINEYSEDIVEGNIGYNPWKFIYLGAGASYNQVYINTEEISFKYGISDFRLSILLLAFDWLNVSYLQENIYTIVNREREDLLFPNQSFGLALIPSRGVTFVWNINRLYYGYVNSFSVTANLLNCLSFKGGYSKEISSYSASVNFLYNEILVSYGLSRHTYLGLTHKFGVTISNNTFMFQQVNYNKKLFRKSLSKNKKKIHINNCSVEELLESKLFSILISERIIKYRNVIGPITKKSLAQIGVKEKKIKDIKKYTKGFAPEVEKKNKSHRNYISKYKYKKYQSKKINARRRKTLFKKLIENGLTASMALKIAEKVKYNNKSEIIIEIKNLSGIKEDRKKQIIKICNDLL